MWRAWIVLTCLAVAGCLYKSGGKYVGTYEIAHMEVQPTDPIADRPLTLVIGVRFTGKTTNSTFAAKVKLALDDAEPRFIVVPMWLADAQPGVYTGEANVNLGPLTVGEHRIALDIQRPAGLVGSIPVPVNRSVAVKAEPPP